LIFDFSGRARAEPHALDRLLRAGFIDLARLV
jgi:hypothetical protein